MSNDNSRNPLFTNEVFLQKPYTGEVRRDIRYGNEQQLIDIYYPQSREASTPMVLLVNGYPDPGFQAMTGMRMKEMGQQHSWAHLLAASDMIAVTYSSVEPVADVLSLVSYLVSHSGELGIDGNRLAVLSVSGNVPNALHVLQVTEKFRAAALCYGFMLDGPDDSGVSDAAAQFRFVNPNTSDYKLPVNVALMVVRAGRDEFPGLKPSIDRFVANCVTANRDIELVNYANGVHAFDILDSSSESQRLVQRIVDFLAGTLGGE